VLVLTAILTLALAACVVLVLAAPLRRARASSTSSGLEGAGGLASGREREQLEAAREAKYREIRDAELDFRTGKLSRADYETIDAELRAEAIEILNRLERLS